MKTILIILLLFVFSNAYTQPKSIKPKESKKLNYLGKSNSLKDISPFKSENLFQEKPELDNESGTRIQNSIILKDTVIQNAIYDNESIPIIQNFDGVGSINMPNPDTEGDVGPNHYFQMVKSSFAIWDKQGNILYGPAENKTIWSDFPGPWLDLNWTDPIVVYDPLNDRWLASAMVYDLYNEYYEMIAVSATSNPLGEWYCYYLWFDVMPDYPKFGVWPDGYYLTFNEWHLTQSLTLFTGASIMVFNPEELCNGNPEPTEIYFHFDSPNGSTIIDIASFLPSDLDGEIPPAGTPNYHVCVKDDAWGYPEDRLWIWECHVDWADTSNCHFSEVGILETAPFDSHVFQNAFIHQPGTANRLHSLTHFMMYRLQYRNFENYQVLLCNHTVEVDGDDHGAVRWYELRDEGSGWFIHQQSSFAPDADSRWMGSVAMDADGNIGLGYSVSSDVTYPGIRVSGRRFNDDPGVLTMLESEIVAGAGNQSTNPRWGDYSMMSVDPSDNLTFWYTQEYLPVTGVFVWQTKIASFQLHKNLTMSLDTVQFNTYEDCLNGKTLIVYNDSQFDIEIQDIEQEGIIGGAMWHIDPYNFNFPFQLLKGDSIELQIYIDLPVGKSLNGFISDTLSIFTDYKKHGALILLNEDLITNYENLKPNRPSSILSVFPNPFNSSILISIDIDSNEPVFVDIFNDNLQLVNSLLKGEIINSGFQRIEWSGTNHAGNLVPKGIYLIRLKSAGIEEVKKIIFE